MTLILASSSTIRRDLLAAAGVPVEIVAPDFDEEPVKAAHDGDPDDPIAHVAGTFMATERYR